MNLFFHCYTSGATHCFTQLEWALYEGNEFQEGGAADPELPSFTFELIMFLLAVGRANNIIGYDLNSKLKSIGVAMKRNGFELTLDKPQKTIHVDLKKLLPDMKKPTEVLNIIDVYAENHQLIETFVA